MKGDSPRNESWVVIRQFCSISHQRSANSSSHSTSVILTLIFQLTQLLKSKVRTTYSLYCNFLLCYNFYDFEGYLLLMKVMHWIEVLYLSIMLSSAQLQYFAYLHQATKSPTGTFLNTFQNYQKQEEGNSRKNCHFFHYQKLQTIIPPFPSLPFLSYQSYWETTKPCQPMN